MLLAEALSDVPWWAGGIMQVKAVAADMRKVSDAFKSGTSEKRAEFISSIISSPLIFFF